MKRKPKRRSSKREWRRKALESAWAVTALEALQKRVAIELPAAYKQMQERTGALTAVLVTALEQIAQGDKDARLTAKKALLDFRGLK